MVPGACGFEVCLKSIRAALQVDDLGRVWISTSYVKRKPGPHTWGLSMQVRFQGRTRSPDLMYKLSRGLGLRCSFEGVFAGFIVGFYMRSGVWIWVDVHVVGALVVASSKV